MTQRGNSIKKMSNRENVFMTFERKKRREKKASNANETKLTFIDDSARNQLKLFFYSCLELRQNFQLF
jgi:hypothetical protein